MVQNMFEKTLTKETVKISVSNKCGSFLYMPSTNIQKADKSTDNNNYY